MQHAIAVMHTLRQCLAPERGKARVAAAPACGEHECTLALLRPLRREAELHLRLPARAECWLHASVTTLHARQCELHRVATRLRVLGLRLEHIPAAAPHKRHLIGMLRNTTSAAGDLHAACVEACDLFATLTPLLRTKAHDPDDKLVYASFNLIRCLNTLGRRNSSIHSHLRGIQRLLAENGLSALYEQPAGVLLPGECCNHDDAALHFPRCSAVTMLMPDFPVY